MAIKFLFKFKHMGVMLIIEEEKLAKHMWTLAKPQTLEKSISLSENTALLGVLVSSDRN